MGMTRVGPAMLEALEYVRRNPGCSQNEVMDSLSAAGNSWQVVNRAVKAGLIRKEPILSKSGYPKAYKLYAVSEVE